MAAGLAMAVASALIALVSKKPGPWLSWLGRVALTGACLLLPSAAGMAMSLLSCEVVTLTRAAAALLDGGPTLSATDAASRTALQSLVSVTTLVAYPSYVCWAPGGSQRPAGALAIVTLVLYVAPLPALAFVAGWRARWPALDPRRKGRAAASLRAPLQLWEPQLLVSLGYARRSAWFLPAAELAAVVALAALQSLIPRPLSRPLLLARALVMLLVLVSLGVATLAARPFARRGPHTWRLPVRIALLVLAACCVCANAALAAVDLGFEGSSLTDTVAGGAGFLLLVFAAAGLVVLGGYVHAAVSRHNVPEPEPQPTVPGTEVPVVRLWSWGGKAAGGKQTTGAQRSAPAAAAAPASTAAVGPFTPVASMRLDSAAPAAAGDAGRGTSVGDPVAPSSGSVRRGGVGRSAAYSVRVVVEGDGPPPPPPRRYQRGSGDADASGRGSRFAHSYCCPDGCCYCCGLW